MHFLLIGATGRTGKHVVSELLAQGHTAVALVRNTAALAGRKGLTVVQGSPLVMADVVKALDASPAPLAVEAAIITLNANRVSDNPFSAQLAPPRFLADSCQTVCDALRTTHNIRRVVLMSTVGVSDSWKGVPALTRAFMRWTNIKYAIEDHNLVDHEIRQTDMDWTLVRPTRLVFDDAAPPKDMDILGSTGDGKMSIWDSAHTTSVARLLVKIAVEGLYVRQTIVVRD
ncbi:MAG: hypothetical protein STHCBS139747_003866 [Sporothrix thermara]